MFHLRIRLFTLALVSTLVASSWCGVGHAETAESTRSASGEYEYRFVDDDLLGNTLTNGGDVYKVRAGFRRVLLLRPRTAFVVQLFKSVENL